MNLKTKHRNFIALYVMIFLISLTALCARFVKNDDKLALKDFEKDIYILKEDAGEGNRLILKDARVKLHVVTSDNFIKIYCYPADSDILKSERTLLVYLFEDDFDNKKFDINLVQEELMAKAEKYIKK